MKFSKLIWSNIYKTISNYIIFWFFDISIMFFLYVGSFIGNSYKEILVSNALPIIILLVAFIVLYYITRLMLVIKGKEFSIYLLIGISKNGVKGIYIAENLGILLLALLVGLPLAIVYSYISVFGKMELSTFIEVTTKTIETTIVYFLIYCIYTVSVCMYFVDKNNIKDLLAIKKKSEGKRKCNNMKQKIVLLIFLFVLYIVSLNYIEQMLSLVFLLVVGMVYMLIMLFYDVLALIRKSKWLMQKNRLYLVGNILRKSRSKQFVYTILNICFGISSCSYIFGEVFQNTKTTIISLELDRIMGYIQTNISLLFFVTICFIINLNQFLDVLETKRDYYILMSIGRDKKSLFNMLRREISINGGLSVLVVVPLLIIACCVIQKNFDDVLLGVILGKYIVMCTLIFIFCEMLLYYSIKKAMKKWIK